ncbi:MAG: sugar porter family MFS transporter [Paludibacteraceae bacterium]|nr:sugar porter family MFS transporter [Paludibacteraceae bacterium]
MKRTNLYLLLIALVSAMGGLLFGYDWVVIGGAKPFYEQYFSIAHSPHLQGLAMSTALLGCLIGALTAGRMSDRYGRKPLLLVAAMLFFFTSWATGAAHSFLWFNIFRFTGGIAIGMASSLSPMYIAEISPTDIRGRLVAVNQLTTVLGILSAQVVNWLIAEPVPVDATGEMIASSWNGQTGWRCMFWAMMVPSGIFFMLGWLLPESPRWLIIHGKEQKAVATLLRVGGEVYASQEVARVQGTMNDGVQATFREVFKKKYSRVLLIGIVLAVFQQWCGTNVIFNYAQEIFMAAGYGVSDVLMNIVITGITNVVFTIVAMFLVDKLGRKALLLAGAFGLALIYLLMGGAYWLHVSGVALVVIVVLAIACYAMTLAPVMWVVVSEIFPNKIRGVAMSVATFALWAACSVLTYTFPLLNSGLGAAGTFWLYGGICLAGGLFVMFCVPETKGKSLEQIEQELVKNED